MAKHFVLEEGENLLAEGLASHFKSFVSTNLGHCYLTNMRLVFCKKQMTLSILAAPGLGPVVSALRKQTKITFEIPVNNIKSIDRRKYGFSYKDVLQDDHGKVMTLQLQDELIEHMKQMGVAITVHQ